MTFAERYAALVNDPTCNDNLTLYRALAQATLPRGTAEDHEKLALLLAPRDLPLLAACAEIEAKGGAA